jgi:hypothetical protein
MNISVNFVSLTSVKYFVLKYIRNVKIICRQLYGRTSVLNLKYVLTETAKVKLSP